MADRNDDFGGRSDESISNPDLDRQQEGGMSGSGSDRASESGSRSGTGSGDRIDRNTEPLGDESSIERDRGLSGTSGDRGRDSGFSGSPSRTEEELSDGQRSSNTQSDGLSGSEGGGGYGGSSSGGNASRR